MKKLLLLSLVIANLGMVAQPILLPSIGIGTLPADSDPVCTIPWYLGSFNNSGLQNGDTAYDFTLFDLNGDSLNLATALSYGRPVLLVAASYTCPVYRDMVPVINDIVTSYAGLVDVYIIYTVEAHPAIDTSVYFGFVQTGAANIAAGILYEQPDTYGERKAIVDDMLDSMTTLAPVFIDGPCNNWWSTYGPAPNNSYLIDTNGVVFSKHAWFDRHPENIYCDLDSLLGTNSGNCTGTGLSTYTFQLTSAATVYDVPGATISVDAEITNTGTQDILIYARKLQNDMPAGWASSMCIDVCYSTSTDSTVFLLPAGVTQAVHVYFYTSALAVDTGYVRMGFKNLSDTTNKNIMHAFGITTNTSNINELNTNNGNFSIAPNPVTSTLNIYAVKEADFELQIFNMLGEQIIYTKNERVIDVSALSKGIYFAKVDNTIKRFVKN
jgi:hypothetical protein